MNRLAETAGPRTTGIEDWTATALLRIEADFHRSADTHLVRLNLAGDDDIQLYLKDESTHPSGSLKHRLARSLFLHALCSGWIGERTTVVEASSGSTAVSEAYFARLLGLRFVAVMPRGTSRNKIARVEFFGAQCEFVDRPADIYGRAAALAQELSGHYMDQFTYAERATDWRGNNNIAQSIFDQLSDELHPVPAWIVVGAGTGGTAATIGRYIRYRRTRTRLLVPDPEGSVFFDYWRSGERALTRTRCSRIEGIGRPRVEPSFIREVVDDMFVVPDAASIAAARYLSELLGRTCGGSSGTCFWAALHKVAAMRGAGERGSVVTLIGDPGSLYADTIYNDDWVLREGLDLAPYRATLDRLLVRALEAV